MALAGKHNRYLAYGTRLDVLSSVENSFSS